MWHARAVGLVRSDEAEAFIRSTNRSRCGKVSGMSWLLGRRHADERFKNCAGMQIAWRPPAPHLPSWRRPVILPAQRRFNAFLFAAIGDDKNGMVLTVASALARLGLDPWNEAGRLASLPKIGAAEALARMIAKLPVGDWQLAELSTLRHACPAPPGRRLSRYPGRGWRAPAIGLAKAGNVDPVPGSRDRGSSPCAGVRRVRTSLRPRRGDSVAAAQVTAVLVSDGLIIT